MSVIFVKDLFGGSVVSLKAVFAGFDLTIQRGFYWYRLAARMHSKSNKDAVESGLEETALHCQSPRSFVSIR